MGNLMDSLGLDDVEADPNFIPNNKYGGVIFKCDYVYSPKKDTLNLVITYKITDGGKYDGREKDEWWTLGTNPQKDLNGEWVSMTPAMSEAQKPWFKKRLMDLGIPESKVNSFDPSSLVGTEVFFGVRKNDQGFINVNFVERRNPESAPEGSVDPFESGYLGDKPTSPSPGQGQGLSDLI